MVRPYTPPDVEQTPTVAPQKRGDQTHGFPVALSDSRAGARRRDTSDRGKSDGAADEGSL